ncbi:unnamed protein product [Gemmata massiliana]|uniref:Uncharacterized protein n=1 Tax=Gemmata massiliana TaxID=1210884 RepID=A0A6P2D6Z1_9BACT|nr:unnamed protein product [Gemmata massiliana]
MLFVMLEIEERLVLIDRACWGLARGVVAPVITYAVITRSMLVARCENQIGPKI